MGGLQGLGGMYAAVLSKGAQRTGELLRWLESEGWRVLLVLLARGSA